MFIKSISIILIASLLFQIGCATTTKTIPVASDDYDKLKKEKIIFVTVKGKYEYELIDFEVTDTNIKGTSITRRPHSGIIINEEKIVIKLENVEFIMVKKTKTSGETIIVFFGLFILLTIAGILYGIGYD